MQMLRPLLAQPDPNQASCPYCTLASLASYGCSINVCEDSTERLDPSQIDTILPCFKQGKVYMKARDAANLKPDQPNLIDMVDHCIQGEVEDLLMRGHFRQGSLSDLFWDNPHLQRALAVWPSWPKLNHLISSQSNASRSL